jgi:hypothetical protein
LKQENLKVFIQKKNPILPSFVNFKRKLAFQEKEKKFKNSKKN